MHFKATCVVIMALAIIVAEAVPADQSGAATNLDPTAGDSSSTYNLRTRRQFGGFGGSNANAFAGASSFGGGGGGYFPGGGFGSSQSQAFASSGSGGGSFFGRKK